MPIMNFQRRYEDPSSDDALNIAAIESVADLTPSEQKRLKDIETAWDFYEGYHWEDIENDSDSPQVTTNYCRLFVNKFVAFELGKGFTIEVPKYLEKLEVTVNNKKIEYSSDVDSDGLVSEDEQDNVIVRERYMGEFLELVWKTNKKNVLITEIGQTKSITGDAWIHPKFVAKEDLGQKDPFNEFPNGKIEISVLPSQYVFPTMDEHDKDVLVEMLIMYPIKKRVEEGTVIKRTVMQTVMYKEFWTPNEIVVYEDSNEVDRMENPYGFLPFVLIKNFPTAGRVHGTGDLEDVIPLNTEYNLKNSDVSEVIDYHSAPITLVYGAKVGNLEKGANKVWGGLPKDAKVENLGLNGDLVASQQYIARTKTAMCEVGCNPESTIGGAQAISNTSGVALQYMNAPLVDRTNVKRECTKDGLEVVNKMIISIALSQGLIRKPEGMNMSDFLANTVNIPDTLPKDELIELQMIQQELLLGLECRHGALQRLGREDIYGKLAEIDRERAAHPELFSPELQQLMYQNQYSQVNSGMLNGQSAVEQQRVEMTGQNGGAPVV